VGEWQSEVVVADHVIGLKFEVEKMSGKFEFSSVFP
jgi:hypothetical protein